MALSKSGKWYVALGVIATLGVVGTGVYFWAKTQISLISDFCYKIRGFKFYRFTQDTIEFSFSIDLKNQSNIEVDLKELTVDVYIDKYKITTLSKTESQTWAKNAVSTMAFDVSIKKNAFAIPILEMIRLGVLFVSDKKNFLLSFKGEVRVNAMGIPIPASIPFAIDTNLQELMTDTPTTCKI